MDIPPARKPLASHLDKPAIPYNSKKEQVKAYFQAQSSYWKEVYERGGVQAEIYRMRQVTILSWIDDLALASGSHVLEIGCGAGLLSVALAQRGWRVQAIDSVEAMVELTRQHAEESEMAELLSVEVGDVYTLPFADDSFDLVVAIGVIPWLAQPEMAIREMARVMRAGGHLLLTADNRARLTYLLDPLMNPFLEPLRERTKASLEQIGLLDPSPRPTKETLHSCGFIDKAVMRAGLMKTRSTTLGFGPFRFLGHKVLPQSLDTPLHHQLQRLADRNVPLLSSSGTQYLVQARN